MNRDEEIARYVERRGYRYKGDIIRKLSVKELHCIILNILKKLMEEIKTT